MNKKEQTANKMVDTGVIILLVLLTLLLLSELFLSLQWRMQHDSPIYYYSAFLMNEHGAVPYKDIFETSIAGTFILNAAICKIFGYGDFAFRLVDIISLVILLTMTWLFMKSLGKIIAFSSILLFGLMYLGFGPSMSLQRDYIGIIPIAAAIFFGTRNTRFKKRKIIALIIGGLFALSVSIKPHLALAFPVIIFYMSLEKKSEKNTKKIFSWSRLIKLSFFGMLGFVFVLSIPFIWLWKKGGLPYFWEIFHDYLPLHIQLSGNHVLMSGTKRFFYLLYRYRQFCGMESLALAACFGLFFGWDRFKKAPQQIRFIILLAALLVLYSIYPVLSGQFWNYHWMPFVYFACLCTSLLLLPVTSSSSPLYKKVVPFIFFLLFGLTTIHTSIDFRHQISGQGPLPPKKGRVDKIANFLKENLRKGDTVQPLDWTGGALHGMLLAKAVIATPYILDYYFYHHISNPYIQKLRKRMMKALEDKKPTFFIHLIDEPRPRGENTTTEFPELNKFIDEYYSIAYEGDGFKIYKRQKLIPVK
ncbi:MAG: hypothetical protein JXB26_13910 [Candidatus Aminicenantes bacterium]|nr:hypothetical protein [Candidatus Aminicenantes bacterium]